jgi:hypothetical protein
MSNLDIFIEHVSEFAFGFEEHLPFVTWEKRDDELAIPYIEILDKHFGCLSEMWLCSWLEYMDSHMYDRGYTPKFRAVCSSEADGMYEVTMTGVCVNGNIYGRSGSDQEKMSKSIDDDLEKMRIEVRDVCRTFVEEDINDYLEHLEGGAIMN